MELLRLFIANLRIRRRERRQRELLVGEDLIVAIKREWWI
jgi:hypothetical protein